MATKTDSSNVGFSADLKPRLIKHYGTDSKKGKVRSVRVPGFGRFAFTRDEGEADLFTTDMFSSHLGAILRAPDRSIRGQIRPGEILDEFDLGSGKVTNIGVTALANDSKWFANENENLATFNTQKYMNWGKGTNAAEAYNWKLQTQEVNEASNKEAVAVESSVLKWAATGNAQLIVTGTLEAKEAGPVAITEWGLFSAANTEGTTPGTNTSTTATELNDTGKFAEPAKTESKKNARGAQQYVVWAKEAEEVYGLVLKNTETKATIPGWVKSGAAELGATPTTGVSKYAFYPVMWDRRVFAAINVEKGNKITFPYELTVTAGG